FDERAGNSDSGHTDAGDQSPSGFCGPELARFGAGTARAAVLRTRTGSVRRDLSRRAESPDRFRDLVHRHPDADFRLLAGGRQSGLARNAAAVILVHNHPSGCAEPSQADQVLTETLKQALMLVDIKVLDHFIVGGSVALSFAERGPPVNSDVGPSWRRICGVVLATDVQRHYARRNQMRSVQRLLPRSGASALGRADLRLVPRKRSASDGISQERNSIHRCRRTSLVRLR